MIRQTNDTLLCHLIASDQMLKGKTPKVKTDEIKESPKQIKVAANQTVYIHSIYVKPIANFQLTVTTPTSVIKLNEKTTLNGSFNTIIRGVGTVKFSPSQNLEYIVQFVRVQF